MRLFSRVLISCVFCFLLNALAWAQQASSRAVVTKSTIYSFKGDYQYADGEFPNGLGLVVGPGGELYGFTNRGGTGAGLCGGDGCGAVFKLTPPSSLSARWTETLIYRFRGGCNGAFPNAGALVRDSTGAIYGTTSGASPGCGTVFKLTPPAPPSTQWTHSVLAAFPLGVFPHSLVRDPSNGILYGVTKAGGAANMGSVFKLTPPVPPATQWTRTILYSFRGGADGIGPFGAMVIGADGSLFGITNSGGISTALERDCPVDSYPSGCGVVFRLNPPVPPQTAWSESVIYRFKGYDDGAGPQGDLLRVGNALFGMTAVGGSGNAGTIFRLTPPTPPAIAWTKTTLYQFPVRATDRAALFGYLPYGRLVRDSTGALFGTTTAGGLYASGVAYKLAPPVPPSTQWTETVLHHFRGGLDGVTPMGFVRRSSDIYGVTSQGGANGWGSVFKISGAVAP